MSDFKTPLDFRKGSYRKYPYQDPTYLSFALLFDWNNRTASPLLSGPAVEFLEKLAGESSFYAERLEDLKSFLKALREINSEMPWYWQSLKGMDRLQKYDPMNPYWGGDDAKIEIETLESLNLPILGLMHLYRRAIFDEQKWTYIIPKNLRKFKMYIYMTEVRSIQSNIDLKVGGIDKNTALQNFPDNIKPTISSKNLNADIMGDKGRPYFMTGISYCEFDITSGIAPFSELTKNPSEPASNNITISYESLDTIEARVLNGIIEQPSYSLNNISPAPDSEFEETVENQSLNDFVKGKLKSKLESLEESARGDLQRLAEDKKRELEQTLRDKTINRIPNLENVFSNFVRGIDEATDIGQATKNIGNAINANVFGVSAGSTIREGLDKAALNNLGNIFD